MSQVQIPQGINDDFDLMARIQADDRSALESLYDRYSGVVMALCARMLGDRNEAEDCLIDVFAEVWEKADRFDPTRAAPVTYLMMLARSRAIDRRRSMIRRKSVMETGPQGLRQAADGADASSVSRPGEVAELAEARVELRAAMEMLQADQKRCVEFAYYDGLSHSEIAEKLGRPLGTVKTFIRQGLQQLRQKLCREN